MTYNPNEQKIVLSVFVRLLDAATKDGGEKRARGEKPPWYVDPTHERHLFSHMYKWKNGERVDADSGSHPLVHGAWRMLALAYQDTYGRTPPQVFDVNDAGRYGALWSPDNDPAMD